MKTIIVSLGKLFLKFIYFFIKLLPVKKQIVFISMQSNKPSLDFTLLSNEIKQQNNEINIVFLCKKMKSSLCTKKDYISYVWNMIGYVLKTMYYLATSKVCITESYCVPISILKHKNQLTIIQIWHASGAVKKFGYQCLDTEEGKSKKVAELMCMHKNYDYVIAPSEATKEIFAEAFNIEKEKIAKLGLPRLEYIVNPEYDKSEEFYKQYPTYKNKKIILYVPTFRKGKKANLEEILSYPLDKEKYQLIIKLHPLENSCVPEEYTVDSNYTSYDLIKIADYIITDYSILSIEASLLEKPIFLYLYDLEDYIQNRGLNINLNEELKTFTSKNINDIMNKIETQNYDIQEIKNYRNKYIEVNSTKATKDLAEFVLVQYKKKEEKFIDMKKKLKKLINSIMKKNVFLRKVIRKIHYIRYNLKYNLLTKRVKVDEKLIIFACFNGRSYCDSPKALYKQMLEDKSFEEYKFIWAFNDIENYTFLEENKNTQLVKIGSKEYLKSLGRAKYWIFNYKIPDYIYPKENQIFVQCWHGTPLKRLGCDLQHFNNAMNSLTEIKKRYHMEAEKFSYFLSPSKFATEKFISTWDLKQIGKENIMIEEGYPRNDFLMNYTQKDIESIKEKLNLKDCNKKIILYAPTYRDNQHTSGVGYTYETKVNFDNLRESLGDEYVILFREHWLVAQSFNFENYKDFVIDVSNYDDINELYVISDLLITDYSSVFFDYANLKRPIIFYMYDLEDYRDNIRGFYLDIADLPGKIIKTENELIEEIRLATTQFKYDKKYENFNKKFNYLDDGQASKRVIDKIFKSNLGGKI